MKDKVKDRAFRDLKLRASLCPGMETNWEPGHYLYWIALHKAANELRDIVGLAMSSMDDIDGDNTLSPEGKRQKKQATATQTLDQLDRASSLDKARDTVDQQMQKWAAKIAVVVKPAQTEAEAVLHAEIRRHVASLKDPRERASFLEKRGADAAVASAVLEAPAFLSGLSDAEIALVRAKVEQQHLTPEIVAAKVKLNKALAETERGLRAAHALVAQRAGLRQAELNGSAKQPQLAANKTKQPGKAPAWA